MHFCEGSTFILNIDMFNFRRCEIDSTISTTSEPEVILKEERDTANETFRNFGEETFLYTIWNSWKSPGFFMPNFIVVYLYGFWFRLCSVSGLQISIWEEIQRPLIENESLITFLWLNEFAASRGVRFIITVRITWRKGKEKLIVHGCW